MKKLKSIKLIKCGNFSLYWLCHQQIKKNKFDSHIHQ